MHESTTASGSPTLLLGRALPPPHSDVTRAGSLASDRPTLEIGLSVSTTGRLTIAETGGSVPSAGSERTGGER
jgi:hypothetical protein